MTDSDRAAFVRYVRKFAKKHGVWATLHTFTDAVRPACEKQAEAEKPPKQPRRKQ